MATRKSFLLRISPELYESLEHWAADELRSANAQIEYLLTDAVRRAGRERKPSRDSRSSQLSKAPESPRDREVARPDERPAPRNAPRPGSG